MELFFESSVGFEPRARSHMARRAHPVATRARPAAVHQTAIAYWGPLICYGNSMVDRILYCNILSNPARPETLRSKVGWTLVKASEPDIALKSALSQ